MKTYKRGFTISKQNLNDDSERLFSYPYLQMQRKEIINILIEEINNFDPNIIRTDHSFESFTENDKSVLVHFNNQKSFECQFGENFHLEDELEKSFDTIVMSDSDDSDQ